MSANRAASIRARLKNHADATKEDFNHVLTTSSPAMASSGCSTAWRLPSMRRVSRLAAVGLEEIVRRIRERAAKVGLPTH